MRTILRPIKGEKHPSDKMYPGSYGVNINDKAKNTKEASYRNKSNGFSIWNYSIKIHRQEKQRKMIYLSGIVDLNIFIENETTSPI